MRLNCNFAATALGDLLLDSPGFDPTLSAAEAPFSIVTIDSRECAPGAFFACLPGENGDGHTYAQKAVDNGCTAVLATRNPFEGTPPVPVLVVASVEEALRALAIAWRNAYLGRGKVVGLTGTAGKTTVKETLSCVLSQECAVCRTKGNFNNHIGLPLSLLNADLDALFWIMEAGISLAGDMDDLGSVLRPDLALILNAGPGHTAGLGKKGTAHYKAALLKYLQPGGIALISADYPDLVREARNVHQVLTFFSSTGRQVGYRSAYVGPSAESNGENRGLYRLWLNGESLDVETPFTGAFGAENVVAVAATAHLLGLSGTTIAAGLACAQLPKQRFARSKVGNWQLIDDSYNANPLSAMRMIDAAAEMAVDDPLVLVLGEMRELGDIAEEEHQKLGRMAAEKRARAVFWTGGFYENVLMGLQLAGFTGSCRQVSVEDPQTLMVALHELGLTSGVILFKGSRANQLEKLVEPFAAHILALSKTGEPNRAV